MIVFVGNDPGISCILRKIIPGGILNCSDAFGGGQRKAAVTQPITAARTEIPHRGRIDNSFDADFVRAGEKVAAVDNQIISESRDCITRCFEDDFAFQKNGNIFTGTDRTCVTVKNITSVQCDKRSCPTGVVAGQAGTGIPNEIAIR